MSRFFTLILVFAVILTSISTKAQLLGGSRSFSFLDLPVSARQTALTEQLNLREEDNNFALRNPALLNPEMDKQISFNTLFHFEDIQSGFLNYSFEVPQWHTVWHAGIHYLDYGKFTGRDQRGVETGTFEANDLAFHLGAGHQLYERMAIGLNVKYVLSSYESYQASALAFDLGLNYFIEDKKMGLSLTVNNFGKGLSQFTPETREIMPVNVQFSYTKEFEHLPFRYSIIYRHLENWDLQYEDQDTDIESSGFILEDSDQDVGFVDRLLLHFVVNAELMLGQKESVRLRASYNHLRRQELSIDNAGGGAGFSFGVGIRISKFRIDYGRSIYHYAGGTNHLSFSTNINFFKDNSVLTD
jgi:hypothetical protein